MFVPAESGSGVEMATIDPAELKSAKYHDATMRGDHHVVQCG
jgi:hypothetical protein